MAEEYYADGEEFFLFNPQGEFEESEEKIIHDHSMIPYLSEESDIEFDTPVDITPFIKGECTPNIPWGVSSSFLFGILNRNPLDQNYNE